MLVISYSNHELVQRCTKLEVAQEWLGTVDAQALIEMIADAEAFDHAKAFMDFYGADVLDGAQLSFCFSPSRKALFIPTGKFNLAEDGSPDWKQIRRLILVEVLLEK